MKKYNCNNTLEYVHEYERMCNIFRACSGCPMHDLDCWGAGTITSEHVKRVQEWSDANPEIVLTAEQRKVLEAMRGLWFKYLVKDANGEVYLYTDIPRKVGAMWENAEGNNVEIHCLGERVAGALSPLVEWSDREPLNIAEALEQEEEANP